MTGVPTTRWEASRALRGHRVKVQAFTRKGGRLFTLRCACGWESSPAKSPAALATKGVTHVQEMAEQLLISGVFDAPASNSAVESPREAEHAPSSPVG